MSGEHPNPPPSAARTDLPTHRARVFTGTRPTGPWHIGQMWGVLNNMVKLQENYDCFYCIVDYHALTTAYKHPERIQTNIREIAMDWIAGGIDPEQCTLFVQSHVPEVAEFCLLLSMITPVAWLERNPTYAETLKENAAAEPNTGLFTYPVLQTADICLYKGELVPIGRDQAVHLHLSQDIAKTFQHVFKRAIFPVPDYLFAEVPLVPGLDNRKMSKSYGNAIDMKESAESTTTKVMGMYTDPQKQRMGDPGRPELCPVYLYHTLVSPKPVVQETETGCRAGTRGCVECKRELAGYLNEHLAPMRARRRELEKDVTEVDRMLARGAQKARAIARETITEVRGAMGLERGFYVTDGGTALPPALQFNPSDPAFQGGVHAFAIALNGSDEAARAQVLAAASEPGVKVIALLPSAEGELALIASNHAKWTLPGLTPRPFKARYRVRMEGSGMSQVDATAVVGLWPKLVAMSTPQVIGATLEFELLGKRLSPSDELYLAAKLPAAFGSEGAVATIALLDEFAS